MGNPSQLENLSNFLLRRISPSPKIQFIYQCPVCLCVWEQMWYNPKEWHFITKVRNENYRISIKKCPIHDLKKSIFQEKCKP